MPRISTKPFATRAHFLAQETEDIIEGAKDITELLAAHEATVPKPVQIRLMGNAQEVAKFAQQLVGSFNGQLKSVAFYKLEHDKNNRVGKFDASNVRCYINLKRNETA
ncbi:MAG: hypothetical protein HY376_01935 [Candidatus Blackburnbacteria bacterium]|nr:hypothetical protein [Candidatus Blackburnbacteria bacterium]